MSKKPIDFTQINEKALAQLKNFAETRIAIAKEDQRHKTEKKSLNAQLDAINENRERNINAGFSRDEVLIKFSTLEVDKAIRQENDKHKEIMKPLNEELRNTYAFIPENMYDGYVRKVELQKRGEYINYLSDFLKNLGIKEVSQSALCKLAEQIADYLGVMASKSSKLLKEHRFSCVMHKSQFNKLFMSIFCDILSERGVIEFCFD